MDTAEPRPFVPCCACSRPIILPTEDVAGSEITCIFCYTKQRVREMTVYVTDPLDQPQP